jgi:trans-2,3-dihydro-3-hydroxyanthranilate isomerase
MWRGKRRGNSLLRGRVGRAFLFRVETNNSQLRYSDGEEMSMPGTRHYPYVLLDVFTHNALEGNQLAVFTDARGLSDAEMQALAKETNLSETTFILPREKDVERERGVRVRIFTTQEELLFAGHPTLGTAWHLQQQRNVNLVELELNVGKIPISFATSAAGRLVGEMRQRDPEFGQTYGAKEVAKATGVPMDFLDTALPIQTVSTGTAFTIVALKSLAAMRELRVDQKSASEFTRKHDSRFFYFVSRETETPGATLHARMQFYNGEDPATGSAAGCCTAWAVQHCVLASDEQGLIEQGLEIGRPSFIQIRGRKTALGVTDVRVGGGVVEIARGEFVLQ